MESTSASPDAEAAVSRRCENCGAQLLGEHCYACGQPTRGLVRHFSSILGDFVDSVFNFDTRTLRTMLPLLLRPGHLTNEYFHGHRVRYVSPVRLFFFLCIAAFFAVRILVPDDFSFDPESVEVGNNALSRTQTVAEAEALREELLTGLRAGREEMPDAPGARVAMDVAIRAVEAEAARRIQWLRTRDEALARGEEPPRWKPGPPIPAASNTSGKEKAEDESGRKVYREEFVFNGEPWDAETNPVHVDVLPDAGNTLLNQLIGRAAANLQRIRAEPRLLVDTFLEALPQTLFVLLPVFALLLKMIYLFRRRLYMEHLIVALHSHAFLCAALLLFTALSVLRGIVASTGLLHAVLGWLELALAMWMPLYLLLMQKRVYRQGWTMTLIKYAFLGTCYFVLISFGAMVNLAVSVVAM